MSPDNHERFLRDAEEQIDSTDTMKQRSENTLKAIADNYRRLLSDRLARELGMIDVARATGNGAAANHRRMLAETYRSMLDNESPVRAA